MAQVSQEQHMIFEHICEVQKIPIQFLVEEGHLQLIGLCVFITMTCYQHFIVFALVFTSLSSASRSAATSPSSARSYGREPPKGVNGGLGCLACTVVVTLLEQMSVIHNETFVKSYHRLCNAYPGLYRKPCIALGEFFIPQIMDLIAKKTSADVICHAIQLCYREKGQPYCHAFPRNDLHEELLRSREVASSPFTFEKSASDYQSKDQAVFNPCTLPGVKPLCDMFQNVFENNLSLLDLDKDTYFPSVESWRGISWRGRDCNDLNALHHPGAKPKDGDVFFDSNCNGIHGIDLITGKPYEDLFCKDTGYLGLIVLGDSAAANFHIPPEWVTARLISGKVFQNLPFILGNEFDWPQLSGFSGYLRESRWPEEKGHNIDSIYLKLWERNHCNHRDYQNLARNGAESFDAKSKLIKSMARDQKRDQPALVFYSLFGNDVCTCEADLHNMTTPEEMYKNVMETLRSLDKRLPNGSHVILLSLVDGRFIYETVHKHIHPVGELRGDLTYENVFNFLNCLQISPCFGWLNSNETIRNETSERAAQLSEVLKFVAKTTKFENFDVTFLNLSLEELIEEWKSKGGDAFELFEPVDGFHPSLKAQTLAAEIAWRKLESNSPHVLGNINPSNDMITKVFGNQGGY